MHSCSQMIFGVRVDEVRRLAACIKMVGLVSYHGDYLMPGHTEQTGRRTIQKIDPKITTIIYHDGS